MEKSFQGTSSKPSLYSTLNIVRVIKSKRRIWAGHVARMEEGRSAFKILTGIQEKETFRKAYA